jgi:hypothetical protein
MQLTDADCGTVGPLQEANVCPAAAAPAVATCAAATAAGAGVAAAAADAAGTAAAVVVVVMMPTKVPMEEVQVGEPIDGTLCALEGDIDGICCLSNKEPVGQGENS